MQDFFEHLTKRKLILEFIKQRGTESKNTLTNSNNCDISNSLIGKADFLCQQSPLVCEERLTVNPINRRTRALLLGGKDE